MLGKEKARVCQEFYRGTIDCCDQLIYSHFGFKHNNKRDGKSYDPTAVRVGRGKNAPTHKVLDSDKDFIRNFITNLPKMESHYCRANTSKLYLAKKYKYKQDVWKEYAALANAKQRKVCSYYSFIEIWKTEFNIGLFKPKKDECDVCIGAELNPPTEEEELHDYEDHIRERDLSRQSYNIDVEKAWCQTEVAGQMYTAINDRIMVIETDLQKQILTPISNASSFYFMSKLTNYNQTSYIHGHNQAFMVLWHEGLLGKDGLCIANAIIQIIQNAVRLNPNCDTIILRSDNAVSQNKNQYLAAAILYFINYVVGHKVRVIIQMFGIPGHSSVFKVDSVHSALDSIIKGSEVFSPWQLRSKYLQFISPSMGKYVVKQMTQADFIDYRPLAKLLKFTGEFRFLNARQIQFTKGQNFLQFKNTCDPEVALQSYSFIKKIKTFEYFQLPLLTDLDFNVLSAAKISDLKNKGCKSMPKEHAKWYHDFIFPQNENRLAKFHEAIRSTILLLVKSVIKL